MFAVGSFGYGLAALGYAVLFFLLLVAWQGRGSGWSLVVAALVTALWAAAMAVFTQDLSASTAHGIALDALRYGSWLAVSAHGARLVGPVPRAARAARLGCLVALCAGAASLAANNETLDEFALVAGLSMSVLGAWLLMQTYVASDRGQRRQLAFLGLGFGSIMGCDVLLYSQALLSGTSISAIWAVRGYAAGLAVPLIALTVTRGSRWPYRFTVSRDVAFNAALATAVVGYVLLGAIGGHMLRLAGGTWGIVAQSIFYLVALAVLIVLVRSTSLRRRLKVLLLKHFFAHKYEYREEWLRFIATLSDSAAGEDSRVTGLRAIAQIIESPAAALLMADEGCRRFKFAAAWPAGDLASVPVDDLLADACLLELLGRRQWVVDLADRRHGRSSQEFLQLPDWWLSQDRWRLIVPLLFKDRLMGMILLGNPPRDFALTFEDRDLLKTVARHVATHIAQHESEQRLAESRQFEAYSRLAAFLLHDLKNAAAQLQMVVANAERHKQNPAFIDDAIDTVANAAARISRLIDQLGRGGGNDGDRPADVERIVAAAVERSLDRKPHPAFKVETSGLPVVVASEQLGNVVEHLIRNAQDATPADGKIEVLVRRVKDVAIVAISDTGHGMSAAFVRDRLFTPFESTKGSKGMGIGAYQAREFARSRGGDVLIESAPGQGTTVRIMLPVAKAAAVA